MAHSQFTSATLQEDGTVQVTGPLTVDASATAADVTLRFLIVQGSTFVHGEGRGVGASANGNWHGTATAQQGSLQAGPAQAFGLAIVVKKDPPGFETLTWQEQIQLKGP